MGCQNKGWKPDLIGKADTLKSVEVLASQIEKVLSSEQGSTIKPSGDLGIVTVECNDATGERLGQLSGAERAYKVPPRGSLQSPNL